MSAASSTGSSSSRILGRASSGESSSLMPAASRSTSTMGQNVMPSPYGRQWPWTILGPVPSLVRNSDESRDLPTPAAPTKVTTSQALFSAARRNASCRASSSRARPTSGESSLRAHPDLMGTTSLTFHAISGSVLPLTVSGPTGSTMAASLTSR